MSKDKRKKEKKKAIQGMPVLQYYAAGADIGDTKHDIAINDGLGGQIVRTFKTYTADVQEAVDWLKEEGVTTVAMESTGVYWIALFLLLQENGIAPKEDSSEAGTYLFVGLGKKLLGAILLADEIKPEAKSVIEKIMKPKYVRLKKR